MQNKFIRVFVIVSFFGFLFLQTFGTVSLAAAAKSSRPHSYSRSKSVQKPPPQRPAKPASKAVESTATPVTPITPTPSGSNSFASNVGAAVVGSVIGHTIADSLHSEEPVSVFDSTSSIEAVNASTTNATNTTASNE